ncbi:MAG: DUF2249 domain-containing protein [Epsilonproteobacteria bacterium]|nr:DUF2249 domain-containing protein [Campylobacterota bacterium]
MALKEIVLDVSELEPPHPLVQGVAALKALQEGEVLLFKHRMYPCKLQAQIDALGLESEILKDEENEFLMRIKKPS